MFDYDYLKVAIVGGTISDENNSKKSSIISKIHNEFNKYTDVKSVEFNGFHIDTLPAVLNYIQTQSDLNLTLWCPNISNELEKSYPIKPKGSVLICTKLMHDGATIDNAVERIFKMNANAVIAVFNHVPDKCIFQLIDALGNTWYYGEYIEDLVTKMCNLTHWTKDSIRMGTEQETESDTVKLIAPQNLRIKSFCESVKIVANKVETECGGRYFGNCSTRCSYMFPSVRDFDNIFVSGRNMPKDFIKPEDLIPIRLSDDKLKVLYSSHRKPSVDTPVQLALYNYYKNIHFFIHGHAIINNAIETEHYYPCGDMREVSAVIKAFDNPTARLIILNMKNHGFLLGTETADEMRMLVNSLEFKYRDIGKYIGII